MITFYIMIAITGWGILYIAKRWDKQWDYRAKTVTNVEGNIIKRRKEVIENGFKSVKFN